MFWELAIINLLNKKCVAVELDIINILKKSLFNIDNLIHLFIYLFIYLFVYSFIYLFIYLFIYFFIVFIVLIADKWLFCKNSDHLYFLIL